MITNNMTNWYHQDLIMLQLFFTYSLDVHNDNEIFKKPTTYSEPK